MDLDSIDPRSIDVAHEVDKLSFRFYTDKEALRLSVRRLTSPHAFDELGRPIPRGLYDTALGPASYDDGPCVTCGLHYGSCPGHFGHIEMPVPVPNPLLTKIFLKILRGSCWYCPCLSVPPSDLNLLLARLYFEDAGLPKCGFAVEAFRGLRKRFVPSSEVEAAEKTAKEKVHGSVVMNWRDFLRSLPRPLSDYVKDLGSNDVELVERNMLHGAQIEWERAHASGRLVQHRSHGWKDAYDRILSGNVVCHLCFRKRRRTRIGIRGRLFRDDSHGEVLISPTEIESHVRTLWQVHPEVFALLFGLKGREVTTDDEAADYRRLFVRVVLVPPSRFRPTSVVGNMAYAAEHPQNMFCQRLLTEIEVVMKANEYGLAEEGADELQEPDANIPTADRPSKSRFAQAMSNMQEALRDLYDSSGASQTGTVQMTGIRQQLEAKAGLFRQHMMGKRVNFSCRSVIGPDVFLDTDEIGIPESFAKLLSVPEPVTPANLKQMQRAVLNGPDIYPGALAVEDWTSGGEHRVVKFRSSTRKTQLTAQAGLLIQNRIPKRDDRPKEQESQMGSDDIAVDNLHSMAGAIPKRVHRHLKTGDVVLFNRQPTLHRVSIMAHKVRVLPGEHTIRFHYANCGSYNADFDGDEMNVHVPQDYVARAEAEELMLSSKHYIVPTSGAPIRGLIQDHIAAATLISHRDTFFNREEFVQLLFSATDKLMNLPGRAGQKFWIPDPAIYKPGRLWTGKQLISTVLYVVRNGRRGLHLTAGTKAKANVIGREEAQVIFRNGELLQGIIDKSSLGSSMYGIVHAVQEAYGCEASDHFLSAMSRLCVFFLRSHGHTTGVDDLLLQDEGERKRRGILLESVENVGVSVTNSIYSEMSKGQKRRLEAAKSLSDARILVEEMIRRDGKEAEDRLDTAMKSALNKVSSDVMKHCVPGSLEKAFPANGFALMTNTGAKGSAVNAAQISCLLGSTVLEGRRVPRMGGSGATLPCFPPFDASPIAGGFIPSRFLTGISPHEFFFHAMSGREGLLDTSLKTANSGYLQRCLVKHLEGVQLHYDYTVRDSDHSVVQFIYGDDGIDPSKSLWLNDKVDWQVSNEKCLRRSTGQLDDALISMHREKMTGSARSASSTVIEELSPGALSNLGAISESYNTAIQTAAKGRSAKQGFCIRNFLEGRYQGAALEPGEAVGILAAQGVGEPSTQMTLNTFHHAGSSSAHVTLGIPRLRELLMTASKYPKTPSMTLPISGKDVKAGAERLCKRLQNISLVDLLLQIEVQEKGICLVPGYSDVAIRNVHVLLRLPQEDLYLDQLGFGFESICDFVGEWFLPDFHERLRREFGRIKSESGTRNAISRAISTYLRIVEKPVYENFIVRSVDYNYEMNDEAGGDHEERNTVVDEGSDEEYASSSDEDVDEDDSEEDEARDSRRRLKSLINEQDVDADADKNKTKRRRKNKRLDKQTLAGKRKEKSKGDVQDNDIDDSAVYGQLGYTSGSLKGREDKIGFRWAVPAILFGKIDIAAVAKESAAGLKVAHVNRISKCFIDSSSKTCSVITEGSNISEVLERGLDLVDFDRLETNDMFGILNTYGVEAMRAALIQEFVKVFDAYGIPVNIRHLRLIADYMTAHGSYRGFNRQAMKSTPSPFQRITFETSIAFMTDSALQGTVDSLKNPSAALGLGQLYEGGTGGFQLMQRIS